MAQLPKRHSMLVLLILVVLITGCELQRDDATLSDPGPIAEVAPPLAPLGAEAEALTDTSTNTSVTTVEQTAAEVKVIPIENQADSTEIVVVAAEQQTEFSTGAVTVSGDGVEEASSITTDNPEIIAPQAESAVAADSSAQEAIIVDATINDDLPVGGPVAANPPVSQTTGDYYDETSYSGSVHTVQQGDTLYSLAVRYDTSVNALMAANGLNSDVIYAGQDLTISTAGSDYTTYEQQPATYDYDNSGPSQYVVSSGDTLFSIAMQYDSSVEIIAAANSINYPYYIQIGQNLTIPTDGDYYAPPADLYEQPTYQDQPDNYTVSPGTAGRHTVSPGETLYSIAQYYGTTAKTVATMNGLYNPNQIYVGQVLYLP